jgi:hypothetical protein
MPAPSFFKRAPRHSLLIEINPFRILVAGLRLPAGGPGLIDCAAEFDIQDDPGLAAWLDVHFGVQRQRVPTFCSICPPDAFLHRESVHPRKLAEAGYLASLLEARNRVARPESCTLTALDPVAGVPLAGTGTARPGLLLGLPRAAVLQIQQRLFAHGLLIRRLEFGLLPLIGTIMDLANPQGDKRATVVVVLEQEHTTAYIVGKEGVHTPAPLRHGFSSIMQAAGKEFGLGGAAEIRERLHLADDELLLRAGKLVRAIGRELKPLVDSYEMTTGQPVGEIYCAYLPGTLAWIAEPLAQVIGRTPLVLDCSVWLPTAGLQPGEGLPPFGPHWLGALSLAAAAPAAGKDLAASESSQAPWRVDGRLAGPHSAAEIPLVGRRFTATAAVTAVALFALVLAAWQWYVIHSLDTDTAYWNRQMDSHRKLFAGLKQATGSLKLKSAYFDHAYDLMQTPSQVTDFILNLGRTLPPNMRVDRIEANRFRVAMSGSMHESSEQSSRTLGRYMEGLRNTPAIGPLFSSISLTALQREDESDESLAFEITFQAKEARP